MERVPAVRRHDVDWLRVFATYLLFVFHVGKVFDIPPFYHIKNAELSPGVGLLTGFIHQWHMPLFFLLAGWSVYGSLRARRTGAFLRERMRRLLLPFVTGCVLLCPLLKYVELLQGLAISPSGQLADGPFNERFLEFLPTFFTRPDRFTWAHLWFLIYLFTFTLLYLPLFIRLTNRPPTAAAAERATAMVYLPIVPLALIQLTLRDRWPGFQNLYDDWANFSYYSLYFILGFLLARDPAFERAVHREWQRAGVIGLAAVLLMIPTGDGVALHVNRVLSAVTGWCLVVALLGCAARFVAFSNATLRYLSESAFPVYILHQAGVVLVGYWVIQLPAAIGVKFAMLLLGAVVATMVVYHFVVRPLAPLRVLFGMKPAPGVTRGALVRSPSPAA